MTAAALNPEMLPELHVLLACTAGALLAWLIGQLGRWYYRRQRIRYSEGWSSTFTVSDVSAFRPGDLLQIDGMKDFRIVDVWTDHVSVYQILAENARDKERVRQALDEHATYVSEGEGDGRLH